LKEIKKEILGAKKNAKINENLKKIDELESPLELIRKATNKFRHAKRFSKENNDALEDFNINEYVDVTTAPTDFPRLIRVNERGENSADDFERFQIGVSDVKKLNT